MYIEGEVPYVSGGNMPYNYGYGGGFGGFGGDFGWLLIFILLCGGNGFGFGNNCGNGNMLYDINTNTNRGFDNLALNSGIDNLQTTVSNGFANAEVSRCNANMNLLQTLNTNQNATIQSMNSLAMGLQNCCCENRAGLADLKYTVATENCADRQALSTGVRDIIESNTRNTQAILDKLCQQEIDAKNDLIATLRSQLSMADLKASQSEQTAILRAGQNAEVDALYNRLSSCPVPSTPVYGRVPIFTCNGSCGGTTGIV